MAVPLRRPFIVIIILLYCHLSNVTSNDVEEPENVELAETPEAEAAPEASEAVPEASEPEPAPEENQAEPEAQQEEEEEELESSEKEVKSKKSRKKSRKNKIKFPKIKTDKSENNGPVIIGKTKQSTNTTQIYQAHSSTDLKESKWKAIGFPGFPPPGPGGGMPNFAAFQNGIPPPQPIPQQPNQVPPPAG